jgi:hypothetical protein
MMGELVTTEADKDVEAKDALWAAIQLLSGEFISTWQVETYLAGNAGGIPTRRLRMPAAPGGA